LKTGENATINKNQFGIAPGRGHPSGLFRKMREDQEER